MNETLRRYTAATVELAKLKPSIYSPAHVAACLKAARRMSEHELEYFMLSAESNVKRTRKRISESSR